MDLCRWLLISATEISQIFVLWHYLLVYNDSVVLSNALLVAVLVRPVARDLKRELLSQQVRMVGTGQWGYGYRPSL